MNEKERIMNYLSENFNINVMSYSLINELYDMINAKWCGKSKLIRRNKVYTINAYLKEFVDVLNNCYVDVSIYELIDNNIIEYK